MVSRLRYSGHTATETRTFTPVRTVSDAQLQRGLRASLARTAEMLRERGLVGLRDQHRFTSAITVPAPEFVTETVLVPGIRTPVAQAGRVGL